MAGVLTLNDKNIFKNVSIDIFIEVIKSISVEKNLLAILY